MFQTYRRVGLQTFVRVLAVVSGISSAVAFWWKRDSLWEDEVIAITHGLQPFPEFFIEILRNDIHPFFYFLILKFWTSPNIGSDSWALASSLASAICSVAVIFYVTFRVHGRQAALWAAALFCILPTFAWSAGNLRMYSLMPSLAMACWYANREYLRNGRCNWAWGMVLLQFSLAYTHAIGFYFLAFIASAALIEQSEHVDRQRLRIWFGAQAITFVGILPVVASALLRGTEPLAAPGIASLVNYPAQLMSVPGATSYPIAGATFIFFLFFGLSDKASRIPVLVIPCGALLVCILVSSMGKPMFKPPVFTANLVPFLVISAAAGIANTKLQALRIVALTFTLLTCAGTWLWVQEARISENYKSAANYLIARSRPGDVVVVPNVSAFWGIMRYAVGADWGRPLAIMPRQSNEAWTKLKANLSQVWLERMSLTPVTDFVDSRRVRYVIGNVAQDSSSNAARIWIVHNYAYKETVQLGIPVLVDTVNWFGGELSVSLAHPDPTGIASISNPNR